jgi:phosphohistidine phosphatase
MNMYVIRHGEAEKIGGSIQSDSGRPLTKKGEADARMAGTLLKKLDPDVEVILSSPYLHALQTAESVAAGFPHPPVVRQTENLSPGFRPKALLQELHSLSPGRSVVVIGHQPDLSVLLAYLIEGESAGSIAMAPGAIAKITFETGPTSDAVLQWLISPEVTRQLSSGR